MKKRNIPELLAPAGGMEQLKAAVQNGADAVYMGGSLFNARIKAANFSKNDMKSAIDYAHERNVKIYVTLNTLIKDDELFEAFSYANFLCGIGADAVILQDMGLAHLIRNYLPDLPMHLSTQGSVYNKWAVGTARRLGFSRIVPARELSLKEIAKFSAECHREEDHSTAFANRSEGCEVEVFVHGAMCMCYSGQCQMSRALGGSNARSGNRGMCAQPCRLAYKDDNGRSSFLLSPKDICMLENIPELCEAGVDSFKIEGRLKSPQYVAVVTSIYRKYLDMYRDIGDVKVEERDLQSLLQIFNRGGFSKGYLFENPGQGLLSGESPKNQGIYLGKVKGFKKGSTLIDIEAEGTIGIGDGVEVHSKELTGNVISYLKQLPGGLIRIGDIKGKINIGDKVYKVTDKQLLKKAESSYADDSGRKVLVDMYFNAKIGSPPVLTLREKYKGDKDLKAVEVVGGSNAEQARNKPTSPTRIAEQLAKLGDTPLEAADIEIDIDEEAAIPISVINKLRREAASLLLERKRQTDRVNLQERELQKICLAEKLPTAANVTDALYIYSREDFEKVMTGKDIMNPNGIESPLTIYVPLELYMEPGACDELTRKTAKASPRRDIELIPYILNVSRGNLDRYIEENFSDIVAAVRETGIMIGNLGWIEQFLDAGVPVYGDYGLNVYNSQAEKCFEEIGIEVRAYSLETAASFSDNMPLMITEHPILSGMITDRKNKKYKIMRWHSQDKYLIFKDEGNTFI